MSTSAITMRTGLISDSGRTLPVVELRRQRLRVVTTLFLCRDSVGCITAIQSRPRNFQLRTKLLSCQDWREIHACVFAVRLSPLVSGTLIVVADHGMQSAAVQGKEPPHRKLGGRLVLMNHRLWICEAFTVTKSTPTESRKHPEWLELIEKIGRGERI